MQPVRNIEAIFGEEAELWSPRIVAEVNDYDVKVVRVEGTFPEHVHAGTDEFFMVVSGALSLDLPGATIELRRNDVFTVPKGVRHRPRAEDGTLVLVFEPRGTVNTGDGSSGTPGTRAE